MSSVRFLFSIFLSFLLYFHLTFWLTYGNKAQRHCRLVQRLVSGYFTGSIPRFLHIFLAKMSLIWNVEGSLTVYSEQYYATTNAYRPLAKDHILGCADT